MKLDILQRKVGEEGVDELDTRNYAGFWIRFVAITIDGFILGLPMALAMIYGPLYKAITRIPILGFEKGNENYHFSLHFLFEKFLPNYFRYIIIITILFFIISILYFGILTSTKMQGTVGKLFLGIKVVGQDGNRISFARAIGRYFASMVSSFMYLGYILAAFNEKKQTLHDYVANTFVVKR